MENQAWGPATLLVWESLFYPENHSISSYAYGNYFFKGSKVFTGVLSLP